MESDTIPEPVNIARIAKVVALVGFLLPWVVVSCQGQTIAKASGLGLAAGRMTVIDPMSGQTRVETGDPSLAIWLAILLIVVGLAASFTGEKRRRAIWITATALASALVCILSLSAIKSSGAKQANNGQPVEQAILAQIKVEPQIGYWVTLLGLLAAGGMGLVVITGRERAVANLKVRPVLDGLGEAVRKAGVDDDVKFWDSMASKTDPDLLEEYLVRFPNGRFVELARSRLAKQGVAPPATATAAAGAGPAPAAAPEPAACASCGAKLDPTDAFCGECGTKVSQ